MPTPNSPYPTQAQLVAYGQYPFMYPADACSKYVKTVTDISAVGSVGGISTAVDEILEALLVDDPENLFYLDGHRQEIATSITRDDGADKWLVTVTVSFYLIGYVSPFTHEDFVRKYTAWLEEQA